MTRARRIRESSGDPDLTTALAAFMREAVKCQDLDVVLDEMVRLRCARVHDCRLCQTVRAGEAVRSGLDDPTTDKIDYYERSDLEDRTKAALRVVDWLTSSPDPADERATAPARAHFAERERADLLLRVARNSYQKVLVALGVDGAEHLVLDEYGHSYFDYDAEGDRSTGPRPPVHRG